ncbi:unnamed protein product [Gulo gulo]|uniref:Uncharacterized protein n=1 Tax=Gulo gulo TaxID=48420 RepID=A0A9X9LKP7_GULGU|nr:unnamed protein product [Gulo gulo]
MTTTNIFDRYALGIEAHTVPKESLTQSFLVCFNRLCLSCNWSKGDHLLHLRIPEPLSPPGQNQ